MTQAKNVAIGGSNINSSGKLSLTTGVTGTLPVANGGTGSTSFTATQWTTSSSNIYYTTGNVGIGATAPTSSLTVGTVSYSQNASVAQINGASIPISNGAGILNIGSTDAAAADVGGSLGFTANGGVNGYTTGAISARRESATSGVYSSYMAFSTTASNSAITEKFRIGSAGQLGIGGANYGTSGQVIKSNGSGSAPSWGSVTGTAGAWVNFDGSSGSIRASSNVSSVSRTSQGNYTINFTSAFADASYATCFSASINGGICYWGISEASAQTSSAAYVRSYTNSSVYDPTYCCASFFR